MALTLHGTVADNTAVLDRRSAKPLVINGNMQVSQRGTSFSPSGNTDYYSIDRFAYFATSGATGDATITQASDAPSGTGFKKSIKISPDATETPSGTHNMAFGYAFEGQDVQVLQHGQTSPEKVTLAFWVKSSKTGTYCVQIKEEGITDESYLLFEYAISSANTWEKKIISWTGNSAHAINNDNTQGYRIMWHLATGSSDHASATTSWTISESFKATSNQVNFFDSTSNEWYLTGVQLEVGEFDANSIAPFQHESFGDNLKRCERYFCKSYNYGIAPGTNASSDANAKRGAVFVYRQRDTNYVGFSFFHPSEMRTNPTMTNYSHDGTSGKFTSSTTTTTISTNAALNGTRLSMAYGVASAADDNYAHFVCEAEL